MYSGAECSSHGRPPQWMDAFSSPTRFTSLPPHSQLGRLELDVAHKSHDSRSSKQHFAQHKQASTTSNKTRQRSAVHCQLDFALYRHRSKQGRSSNTHEVTLRQHQASNLTQRTIITMNKRAFLFQIAIVVQLLSIATVSASAADNEEAVSLLFCVRHLTLQACV
jgi:hypothetical protein